MTRILTRMTRTCPPSAVNELTGMALIQRELGAQVIAEFDD